MKYFFDTEFLEGPQKRFFGLLKTNPTIDLISIGIVTEDNREYYAVSKDFNLKEAWNRYDLKAQRVGDNNVIDVKQYWLREKVLKPIWKELSDLYDKETSWEENLDTKSMTKSFSYESMKFLIWYYGKTNEKIAEEILSFVYKTSQINNPNSIGNWEQVKDYFPVEFYGYYSDYDWVVFCWLYGRMIDLPKGFPMYCRDLKQMMDDKGLDKEWKRNNCPEPETQHNALHDARWNYKLYNEIINYDIKTSPRQPNE